MNCLKICASALSIFVLTTPISALCEEAEGFYSTWRLLQPAQKEQFIAGYMKGLSDSRKVSATVIDFIKQNPGQSASVMRTLDNLFGVSPASPTELALEIDKYYSDSDNREAPLAKALGEARAQLKSKAEE